MGPDLSRDVYFHYIFFRDTFIIFLLFIFIRKKLIAFFIKQVLEKHRKTKILVYQLWCRILKIIITKIENKRTVMKVKRKLIGK